MEEELKTIETVDTSPFKHLVMTLGELPTSFVDSMTYYECLAWLVNFIQNTVIPTVNNNAEAVEELQTAFATLKNYVDTYFDNLDIQEEVDNKLDEMAESGQLADIVASYIQLRGILAYNNVAELKAATNVVNGSFAETYGFYTAGDGGGAKYKIRTITNEDVPDDMFIFSITNNPTLVAELIIEDEIHTKQIGLKGDGTTDETNKLNTFFDKTISCNKRIVDNGLYKITDTIYIKGLWRQNSGNNGQKYIEFQNSSLLYTGNANEASVVLYNMFKYCVNGLCIARNSVDNYVEIVGCWHLSYNDWDIKTLHIDTLDTDLEGKTYATLSDEYVSGHNININGTLTIGSTVGAYNNVVTFYNSIINSTNKTYCVNFTGTGSKQNIQFITCDLSYASDCVFNVAETQTGSCSILSLGCYFDSNIKLFSNNDKKGILFTSMASMLPANDTKELANVLFTDFNKNAVINNISTFGNNLPLANINYAINGDLKRQTSISGEYSSLMGGSSAAWSKSYVDSNLCINGKARQIVTQSNGDKNINIQCVTAPRDDKYCAFIHFKVVSGTYDKLSLYFKGSYCDITPAQIGNNEVVIINNRNNNIITAGTDLTPVLYITNASEGLTLQFYEVGVTAGSTYIPHMPLDARAIVAE